MNRQILLTYQDNENQLPGGGVDKNENPIEALHREIKEETGWKILIKRKYGIYQKFIYMPEYKLWAHKICSVYIAKGIYPISEPTETEHIPILTQPDIASRILHSPADRAFVRKFYQI